MRGPITAVEFAKELRRCMPFTGWSRAIAVANSGGPDSTSLLFLLQRHFKDSKNKNVPEVLSVTIDHDLQANSSDVARRAEEQAQKLGLKHFTYKVQWGTGLIPSRPGPGERFEELARRVRLHLLFNAMTQAQAQVLAMGHHADDQVETCMIRIACGSSEMGAAGMHYRRLWGMGSDFEGSLDWFGFEGLRRCIVRPLLSFPKDRLLATCQEHCLGYSLDSTNFQPELTLRNAIRRRLSSPSAKALPLPEDIQKSISALEKRLSALRNIQLDLGSNPELIRHSVAFLGTRREDITTEVDEFLLRHRIVSPPGTVCISCRAFNLLRDTELRRFVLYRVIRYASCYPWGSPQSMAHRKKRNLRIPYERIFMSAPITNKLPTAFHAAGEVSWRPMYRRIDSDDIGMPDANQPFRFRDPGWIISRLPPMRRDPSVLQKQRIYRDVTPDIVVGLEREETKVDILWDCRFLVSFRLKAIPIKLRESLFKDTRIKIEPRDPWQHPVVVLVTQEERRLLHEALLAQDTAYELVNTSSKLSDWTSVWKSPTTHIVPWITITWARPMISSSLSEFPS